MKPNWTPPKYEWFRRSGNSIAHGALTNSKRASCFVKGVYPTHLKSGKGATVTDTDGKQYTDFICGLGANLLGYAHTEVNQAIVNQLSRGCTLSLGTDQEVLLAEKIQEVFPFIHKLRFLKTGSDVCAASLRIARAKTGRQKVLSHGYHGFSDEFVSLTPPALGVVEHPFIQTLISLDQIDESIAAVILEPVVTDNSPERVQWLRDLREKCTKTGTLLIFDEVITGFRFPKFCVANYYGITPDLICLGKAMANGLPIAVIGGHRDVMDCGEWFISSTFAGETLSIAAALKTITLLQTKYQISNLWESGALFLEKFNALWPGVLWIEGYPTRGVFKGEDLTKALFFQEACKAGILFGPSFFFNFAHIDLVDQVLSVCSDIVVKLRLGNVKLEGALPMAPFAQRMRETT